MRLEVGKKYKTLDDLHKACYPVAASLDKEFIRTFTLGEEYDIHAHSKGANNLVRQHIEVPLYCRYTKEQWKAIADENFLCEFSNNGPQKALHIQTLKTLILTEEGHEFIAEGDTTWASCSPVRDKGIRQPWFGGEQPVSNDMRVLVKWRDGSSRYGSAKSYDWQHSNTLDDIVEFLFR